MRTRAMGIYFAKPADGDFGWAGADYGVWGKGVLEAIDYQTGKIRWSHELGPNGSGAGVLTTDSGLTFTGDAARQRTGAAHQRRQDAVARRDRRAACRVRRSPTSSTAASIVVTSSGGVLFAWALPESTVPKVEVTER